ncbi:SDR family oxidoreductase [Streptomyces sp. NBC_01190]|nr:SDR family oxidoreductase [Streptomyces sp. NBC_01190]
MPTSISASTAATSRGHAVGGRRKDIGGGCREVHRILPPGRAAGRRRTGRRRAGPVLRRRARPAQAAAGTDGGWGRHPGAEDFDRAVEVNLRGVMLAMRAEIPVMLDNGGGAIVNTASVGGLVGVPGLSAYTAAKHAVIGLTKSVGLEFATRNVRVNAVAPGGTNTEMLASGTQEQRDFLASLSPMKRISHPSEIAAAIVYLLADATFSTGITLSADGGQSAG